MTLWVVHTVLAAGARESVVPNDRGNGCADSGLSFRFDVSVISGAIVSMISMR